MTTIADAAKDFLSHERIAVTGVSSKPEGHGSNAVYVRLRELGRGPVAINPNSPVVEGDQAYASLSEVPGGVGAVVIGTRPAHARATVEEAARLGISHVWMHRAFGAGSVDHEAAEYGRAQGMTVLEGGCPLMFGDTSDGGHRFMCRMLQMTGAVPRKV
ncbi:CoA-binding protein [Demequina zhanjiangensis]|uniref:CoA-binding protein n=1 Tax=Demequina zhanjiangensis TaxID=3051659 RepID=A0ABT8G0D7_9MICO|nr:CoA-binding protein [Demequina sp. SYSU T00b26]MDN4472600.1 CoA-binding protein [Demequina sp. SYSU T00b26]